MALLSKIENTGRVLFAPGVMLHEGTHWMFGKLFGGSPYVSERTWRIPVEIHFRTPREIKPHQAKIIGGAVFAYPILLFITLGRMDFSLPFSFSSIEFLFLYILIGASGVSWLDMLAFNEPEVWIDYTAGEPVPPKD